MPLDDKRTTGKRPTKRVLVVDDSRSMRLWLRHVLDNDTRLHVVGEASDAIEARSLIKTLKPDVITLDIEMPGMNGLQFLDRLMRLHPLPVVMVSSATRRGSDAAVQSLSLGAVDCVVKPDMGDLRSTQRELVRRVFSAACSQVPVRQKAPLQTNDHADYVASGSMPIILIGASTGGVAALENVLLSLNPTGPPVVIVQHMPAEFLISFSQMLNRKLPQDVGLLRDHETILPGQVMLAPSVGRNHSQVARIAGQWMAKITPASVRCLHHPSVDALFQSAVPDAHDVIAVILTGLGRDGAQGMKALHSAGARTIGQDRESSVVYGMPRAAFELGAIAQQLPLDQIGDAVNRLVRTHHNLRKMGSK